MAKVISLRPYHGKIILCKDISELKRMFKRYAKSDYPYEIPANESGRCIELKNGTDILYLMYGRTRASVAHEIAHAILWCFDSAGIDPVASKGEPFCYMLSQIMLDSGRF